MKKKMLGILVCMLLLSTIFGPIDFGTIIVNADPPSGEENENWWIYPDLQPRQIYVSPSFNWTRFWQTFKNHAMWSLEGYNPVTEKWEFCNDSLTVEITEVNDNGRKLNLIFDAPASVTTDYRLTLAIDYKVKQYIHKIDQYTYNLSFEVHNESFNISYNFSDIANIPNIIITHDIKNVDGHDYFWFRARRNDVPSGYHIELDPTYTVSTTNVISAHYATQRKLIRQNNDTLWCTFVERADVHVAWSDNDGVTWNDREVWGAQTSMYPSIAVDSNDVVHLVFHSLKSDVDDYQLEYTNSTDWNNLTQIKDEDKWHQFPSIAIDGNDNLHVVYQKSETGVSNDDQVAYINSMDNGGSWGTEQILTDETDIYDDWWLPSVAIDNDDVIHVVFSCEDHYLGKDDILHMQSNDGGITWTDWETDPIYQDSSHDQRRACIVIDDFDVLHVIWHGTNQYTTFQTAYSYNDSNNDSSGWSDVEWITWDSTKHYYNPSVSIDGNGHIHTAIEVYGVSLNHSVNNINWTMNMILDGDYGCPNMISTQWPIVDGIKINRPRTGYALITAFGTSNITYYASEDLTWDTIINTSIDGISPYNQSSPLTINATSFDADCDNVTLMYRYLTNNNNTNYYQENANAVNHPSCGLWNQVYDGNWISSFSGCGGGNRTHGFMNYTKPTNAQSGVIGARWYASIGRMRYQNYSLPSDCWNMNPLQFRWVLDETINSNYIGMEYYNGTVWRELFGQGGANFLKRIYEEAMWWNISFPWTVWNHTSNPDDTYPWSWNFNFPNGPGHYEFCSIGKKIGLEDENLPNSSDAQCNLIFTHTTNKSSFQFLNSINSSEVEAGIPLPGGLDIIADKLYLSSIPGDIYEEHVIITPYAGQGVYPHCVFTIEGSGSVPDFYIRIWLRTQTGYDVVDTEYLCEDLGIGTWVVYFTTPWIAPGGTYYISENVDNRNDITETNENNNYAVLAFTVTPTNQKFDLKIEDLWLSSEIKDWWKEHELSSPLDAGTEVFFTANWTIWGVPETMTDPYYIILKLIGNDGFEYEERIEAEELRTAGYTVWICLHDEEENGWSAVMGDYTFTCMIDTQNDVTEWNENNNELSVEFTVETPNQPPTVDITYPVDEQTVSGIVTITGTADDTDGTVTLVKVKIDSGSWQIATGTTSWTKSWDTDTVPDGHHTIYAKSYDGDDYSAIDSVTVNVDNEPDPDFYFLHITDIHVTAETREVVMGALLEEINELYPPPAFVLATGDLLDTGQCLPNYNFILDPFDGEEGKPKIIGGRLTSSSGGWYITPYNIPIYFCPGNHDSYSAVWQPISFDNYETHIADSYYYKSRTVEGHDIDIFSLNSGTDVDWPDPTPRGDGLKNEYGNEVTDFPIDMDASTADIKIILTHHPYNMSGGDQEMVFINGRNMFFDACDDNDVDLVLSGHIHAGFIIDLEGNYLATWNQDYLFTPSTHVPVQLITNNLFETVDDDKPARYHRIGVFSNGDIMIYAENEFDSIDWEGIPT